MKSKITLAIAVTLFIFAFWAGSSKKLQNRLFGYTIQTKSDLREQKEHSRSFFENLFFTKENIEELKEQNKELKKRLHEKELYIQTLQPLNDSLQKLDVVQKDHIVLSQMLSYRTLNSFTKVSLSRPYAIEDDRIYGLVYGNKAVGVSAVVDGVYTGFLLGDKRCKFSVSVGAKLAPGILMSDDSGKVVVRYIPKWFDIKAGQKIVTSGYDSIFYRGLEVGTVQSVRVEDAYKSADVNLTADIYNIDTFFVVTNPKPIFANRIDLSEIKLQSRQEPNVQKEPIAIEEQNETKELKSYEHNDSVVAFAPPLNVDQTQEEIIEPQPEVEDALKDLKPKPKPKAKPKPKRKRKSKPKPKKKPRKKHHKPKRKQAPLDLF